MVTFLVIPLLAAASFAAPDLTTHEGVAKATVGVLRDFADALEQVQDEKTAKASRPKLSKIAGRSKAIDAALEKLGDASVEETLRLRDLFGPKMEKISARINASYKRLQGDAAVWAVMEPILDDYLKQSNPRLAAKFARTKHLAEKQKRMRSLFGYLAAGGMDKLPMKDGALDIYALARDGRVRSEEFHLFRLPGNKKLPTADEIKKGDYTNFPYERRRGDGKLLTPKPFPLLWDKKPDADGRIAVLYNNGAAFALTKEQLAKALERK